MPIWAIQKRIITPEKAAFVSSFADCNELFVINQRFPSMTFRTLTPRFRFVIVRSLFFAFSRALGWTRMNSSAFPLPYALCLL